MVKFNNARTNISDHFRYPIKGHTLNICVIQNTI